MTPIFHVEVSIDIALRLRLKVNSEYRTPGVKSSRLAWMLRLSRSVLLRNRQRSSAHLEEQTGEKTTAVLRLVSISNFTPIFQPKLPDDQTYLSTLVLRSCLHGRGVLGARADSVRPSCGGV